MNPIIVLTTTDSKEHAQELAKQVVSKSEAACVQIAGPIESWYRWQDSVQCDQEWVIQIKTTQNRFEELESTILEHHHYETPQIVATPIVAGSADYLKWLGEEVNDSLSGN